MAPPLSAIIKQKTGDRDLTEIPRKTKPLEIISTIFFYYAVIIVPLYMENRYFNILEAKWHAYLGSVVLLVFALVLVAMKPRENPFCPQNTLDWLVIAFALNATISSRLSEGPRSSFLGLDGWHVGALTIVTLAIWYFILLGNLRLSANSWLAVMAVNVPITVLAMLQAMRLDIFSLHADSNPHEYHMYISTLGNGNWIVGYLSLLFPLFLGFYLNCYDRISERIHAAFLFVLCMLMVLTGSDGMYIAVGVMAFGLVPYAFRNPSRAQKLMLVVIMYGTCLMMVAFLPAFVGKRGSMRRLAGFFLRPYIAFGIILIGIAAYLALKKIKSTEKLIRIGRNVEIALTVIVVVISAHALSFFDAFWGTGRAWTWGKSLEKYRAFPLREKMWGVGPEMLRERYEDISEFFGKPLTVSHSEPLQVLLTMGAIGLLIWAAICVFVIYRFIKTRAWTKESCIYYLPLFAYMGQAAVNSASTLNVLLLTIIIVLFRQNVDNVDM